jgi:hypothetical protein
MTLFQDPELRKHFVNIKTSWEGFLWSNWKQLGADKLKYPKYKGPKEL